MVVRIKKTVLRISKLILMSLLFFFSFFIIACSESDDPKKSPEETHLSVADSLFTFPKEGGLDTLTVFSNTRWSIAYEAGLWTKPDIETGAGDTTIILTVEANEASEPRSMSLNLLAEDGTSVTISITQDKSLFIPSDKTGMRELTSLQLTQLMGLGWNLGNSLEAITVSGSSLSGGETSWGNPVVTKTFIDKVKAAGFNTIRIPVSWSHRLINEEAYEIDPNWLDRVEEVAGYALDNDMYTIINIHWDGGWMNHPTYDDQPAVNEKLKILWEQISVHFRDYDDKLIFAGTNEVHVENVYSAPTNQNVSVQNSFNQTFVNTVRSTGGRNTYRHLVVQSFNTNIDYAVDFLGVPNDPTKDRLMVEVHFYDPYQFALDESTSGAELWGKAYLSNPASAGTQNEAWVDKVFGDMKTRFVDKGYGVILGEYGAILKTSPKKVTYEGHVASRNHYLNYVTKSALEHQIVPVYWDNGYTGNFGFGLFNRSAETVAYQDAIDAIISADE